MRFGMIGTSFVTDWFLDAGRRCPGFEPVVVYSRELSRGRAYAAKAGVPRAVDSLAALAADEGIDAVYVASPNSCHCAQTISLLGAGKHVLCEKPAAANGAELARMLAAAGQGGAVFLEAARNQFHPGTAALRALLPRVGRLRRVSIVMNQFSSRYGRFLAGQAENVFSPAFAGGALMDIGVYCVQLLVGLFGPPRELVARAVPLPGGADGQGAMIAVYDGFLAELSYSKISQSRTASAIQGEEATLLFDDPAAPQNLRLCPHGGEPQPQTSEAAQNPMVYEVAAFMEMAQTPAAAAPYNELSRQAMAVMDEARRQCGLRFPADESPVL